jgi:hypothetical protein
LKIHPTIIDVTDRKCVCDEINKTYKITKLQVQEATAAERAVRGNRNWVACNWLRLYCCAIDDAVRPFMVVKDNCLEHDELDARNHEERPPTWHEKIAEMYNSSKTYVTFVLPALHDDFAEARTLRFENMPGGPMTAEDAKTRLADARAKLIAIIFKWEQSGNGFGQRDEDDEEFGHFKIGKGDSRSSFVRESHGQKSHHLYLWHLSDTMGVLKNVLNVLSPEIAGDSEKCPKGLSLTQKKRTGTDDPEKVFIRIEAKKQIFRDDVTSMLKDIGEGMKSANSIQSRANMELGIVTLRSAIANEEDRIECYTLLMLESPINEGRQIAMFKKLIARHEERLKEYETQMVGKVDDLERAIGLQAFLV